MEDFSLDRADSQVPDSDVPDAGDRPDTGPCGYDKPFRSPPVPVDLGAAGTNWGGWLSPDESRIYFASYRDGGTKLYFATRDGGRGSFASTVAPLGCCNTRPNETTPTLTDDRRLMVFAGGVSTQERYDLFITQWVDASNDFADATALQQLNISGTVDEWAPFLASGGRKLWFSSNRSGEYDIYVANLAADGGVQNSALVQGISVSGAHDDNPVLSANGQNLYFSSTRNGANVAVWVAHRNNVSDDHKSWGAPILAGVPDMALQDQERPVWISPDECRLYYMVQHQGDDKYRQLYMVERGP
ncbi:hypothetical protein LZC95_51205 [Pendulispora brunnea]|uniref:Uncharacterized protein n=1 Tax=Pendulispora brunnea TaxID=2905690 RepID=A0ABZ2KBS6_9BACT